MIKYSIIVSQSSFLMNLLSEFPKIQR